MPNLPLKRIVFVENLHFWITSAAAIAAVPLLKKLGLPLTVDWFHVGVWYWLVNGSKAIYAAIFLFVIGFPPQETFLPLIAKVRAHKPRLILILAFLSFLCWQFGALKAVFATLLALVFLDLCERFNVKELMQEAVSILLPALYLFAGLLLVAAYNLIIPSVRYFAAYDAFFYRCDLWLLAGSSVSNIARWATQSLPVSFFRFLESVYFAMFAQIGACLILTSLSAGKKRGLQFVGAILLAYYFALTLFFLWPSHGPYYLCSDHFEHFPRTLESYGLQKSGIMTARLLWEHIPPQHISFQYFVAFPCMHIAQPLIVMWYLRKWRRILVILAVHDVFLVAAIIALEWHYVVDVIGGFVVAALAILIVDSTEVWRRWSTQYQQQRDIL